jgi:cysteine synthase B
MAPTSTAVEIEHKIGQRTSLLERIGNSPLLRIERLAPASGDVEVYAKAEWFNPGGSVKDRAAYSMILEGEGGGKLKPGKIILDATSGNTGIAYALVW